MLPIPMMLAVLLSHGMNAQGLRTAIESQADQTFRLTVLNPAAPNQHTFIEFSTNGIWYPAYFTSSNSNNALVYSATNAGGMRLFRAVQGTALANQVKASWERLGVTNYVFDYTEMCLCSGIRATLTVVSNQVVKVENARNAQGDRFRIPWYIALQLMISLTHGSRQNRAADTHRNWSSTLMVFRDSSLLTPILMRQMKS